MDKPYTTLQLLWHWILVTACGPIVAAVIVVVTLGMGISWALVLPLAFVVCGLITGVGQWIVLSTRLKKVGLWIPFTAVGFPLGVILGSFIGGRFDGVDSYLVLSFVPGTLLGGFQWAVLYKKVRNSVWWIPASIFSWTIGMYLTEKSIGIISSTYNPGADYIFLLGVLLGVFVGVIGAIPLALLLRKSGVIQTVPNR